ncbi:hypothetical protein EXN66_Car021412 [Channa argus]|uniref:Uncharacterized protein n=1 Tax=Channa argus TaxID=215402 RepID=A0A6G1QSQ5_CHAAH|nr:hypothetical protein EXN66_Car021412 [Channa argus]
MAVCLCMPVCVDREIDEKVAQGVSHLLANDSWDRPQPPWDPEQDKQLQIMDEWMEVSTPVHP